MNTHALRILLLCDSFNSLSQRLFVELRDAGHEVSVEFDIAGTVIEEAVAMFAPDLIVAPYLKQRIPESVWRRHVCLVVHPGPVGDRGPSALDWAVLRGEPQWGVTVLQANEEYDAGEVWAHADFRMRGAPKSSLYRHEVTAAAVAAVMAAVERFVGGHLQPAARDDAAALLADHDVSIPGLLPGRWQPLMRRHERTLDWQRDDTATVLRKIRSADGAPGVLDVMFGQPCRLFDAHPATAEALARARPGAPGDVVARRGPAVLRRTIDGGVWIGHVRRQVPAGVEGAGPPLKLATTRCFEGECALLPEVPAPLERRAEDAEFAELRYEERGPAGARVGWLEFEFHNGAMGTGQCRQLRDALHQVRRRDTQVLVLAGGREFFSNGIHLHEIEAAAQRVGDSAADASWRNIEAIDDIALELITMTDRLTVAALRGNAGAGGCFLAMAADETWAQEGVVLNPHYKNMGNLYGSEYWTYVLPRRLARRFGEAQAPRLAREITQGRLPLSARRALALGLLDRVVPYANGSLAENLMAQALELARDPRRAERVAAKAAERERDEARKPLAAYREEELARMHRNFYGFDPSYHVARHYFVSRKPHAWTPRHLAIHRDTATRQAAGDARREAVDAATLSRGERA
jgi:putative two-component system protein, hydrogenase maturation factor HypX/HoxX